MYRYSAFSLTIDSELELPELAEGAGEPDVIIRLGAVARPQTPSTIDDEVALPLNVGRFHIRGGREILVDPLPGADPFLLRTMLQGRLMAYLLRQRGCLPLHASAVAIDGQAILFLGESGAGKSTTAAAFYSRGHSVLADDVGAVRVVDRVVDRVVELRTAWPGLRLLDDSREVIWHRAAASGFQYDKHVYRLPRPEYAGSNPVKRIYFLEYATADCRLPVSTNVIPESSAVALLNSHSFLRQWRAGNELLRINLERSASIAAVMPVHRLVRPRSLGLLPELVDFVEKDVAAND
jgi:hypothetical protein